MRRLIFLALVTVAAAPAPTVPTTAQMKHSIEVDTGAGNFRCPAEGTDASLEDPKTNVPYVIIAGQPVACVKE
jgi:hypothetical protein